MGCYWLLSWCIFGVSVDSVVAALQFLAPSAKTSNYQVK